jgi:hypothetical protein
MYGIGRKNDIYKKSKWSSDTDTKSIKSRSDLDINSESDYEDNKPEPVYEKTYSNDYFAKLFSGINEIKDLVDRSPYDKIDNILEYIKSVDSDTKNAFELLKAIESKCLQLTLSQDVDLKCDMKCDNNTKSDTNICDKNNHVIDDTVISLLNNHYNKIRLNMDNLPSKLDLLQGDLEILYNKIDYMNKQQAISINTINKIISDNMIIKINMDHINQKLDHIISNTDYMYHSYNISTISNNLLTTSNNISNKSTSNTIHENIHVDLKTDDKNDIIYEDECKDEDIHENHKEDIHENNSKEDTNDSKEDVENIDENVHENIDENVHEYIDENVYENIDEDIKNNETNNDIDVKILIPNMIEDNYKPIAARSVKKKIPRKK